MTSGLPPSLTRAVGTYRYLPATNGSGDADHRAQGLIEQAGWGRCHLPPASCLAPVPSKLRDDTSRFVARSSPAVPNMSR